MYSKSVSIFHKKSIFLSLFTILIPSPWPFHGLNTKSNDGRIMRNSFILLGDASYIGCFPDGTGPNNRDLPMQMLPKDPGMNATSCIDRCTSFNFAFAGAQNGTQCW